MVDAVPFLAAASLRAAGFPHAFTLREGDFSGYLDPARALVAEGPLAEALGVPTTHLFQVTQVHGADVVVVPRAGASTGEDAARVRIERADAIVAEPRSQVAVGVRVADCVPVLLADTATGRVAAVHAGWRGLAAGVIRHAAAHFGRDGGPHQTGAILAAIGPSLCVRCFEVGDDVAELIAAATSDRYVSVQSEKAHVDLRAAARGELVRAGLTDARVEDVPGCTRCEPEKFYSFRRDGAAAGRHLAVIVAR